MATKKKNERCPLQAECERKCEYERRELDCDYYKNNAREDFIIEDQEERRREIERKRDEERYMAELAEVDDDEEESTDQSADAGKMVFVPIEKLSPHQDNPRKDLGDLTELADSIKVNGILQNLTVVPMTSATAGAGYCQSCTLYLPSSPTMCKEDHKDRAPCKHWEDTGRYTVVIGHRRLAAAKLAGLKELPCVIVDMSREDQIRTMLMENLQRADLTVYEQARGFQMMLNMGASVDEIARKSGFSQTTVRRRVKLLALDQEKLRASVDRGATLFDLMELDKIESADRKNEVLEYVGTENFKYKLRQAIDKEREEKRVAEIVEILSSFATQVDTDDGYHFVESYNSYTKVEDIEAPENSDTSPYFFFITSYGYIRLMREKAAADDDEAEKERRAREAAALEERKARLKEATKRAYDLRREFVDSVNAATVKAFLPDIIAFSIWVKVASYTGMDDDEALKLLGITLNDEEDEELTYDMILAPVSQAPERILWGMTYCEADDGESNGYVQLWRGDHSDNEDLDRLYELLVKMGYQMSDEEKALQDGTHELYAEEGEQV